MSDQGKTFKAVEWQRMKREAADREIVQVGYEKYAEGLHVRLDRDPLWQRLRPRLAPKPDAGEVCDEEG